VPHEPLATEESRRDAESCGQPGTPPAAGVTTDLDHGPPTCGERFMVRGLSCFGQRPDWSMLRSGVERPAADALFHGFFVEIQQQAELNAADAEIRQQLRLMDGQYFLHRFDL
jgi:hypothetical protein